MVENDDVPKFTVIVAQKNHHTKLFQANAQENVPPGMLLFCPVHIQTLGNILS